MNETSKCVCCYSLNSLLSSPSLCVFSDSFRLIRFYTKYFIKLCTLSPHRRLLMCHFATCNVLIITASTHWGVGRCSLYWWSDKWFSSALVLGYQLWNHCCRHLNWLLLDVLLKRDTCVSFLRKEIFNFPFTLSVIKAEEVVQLNAKMTSF